MAFEHWVVGIVSAWAASYMRTGKRSIRVVKCLNLHFARPRLERRRTSQAGRLTPALAAWQASFRQGLLPNCIRRLRDAYNRMSDLSASIMSNYFRSFAISFFSRRSSSGVKHPLLPRPSEVPRGEELVGGGDKPVGDDNNGVPDKPAGDGGQRTSRLGDRRDAAPPSEMPLTGAPARDGRPAGQCPG